MFVDGYVAMLDREAAATGDRISNLVQRPIPEETRLASRGMLDTPLVNAAIWERVNEIASETELSPRRYAKEVAALAFSTMADYVYLDVHGLPEFNFTNVTRDQWKAVQSFEIEETVKGKKVKMKLHDKLGSLGLAGKLMGLDGDNAYWKAESAKPIEIVALPAGVSVHAAGEAYARMIDE